MAEIARPTKAEVSLAVELPPNSCFFPSMVAGDDLKPGMACYIHTDGTAKKATGAAANAAANVRGYAMTYAKVGEIVTLGHGMEFYISDGLLTPGASLYLSGTVAGGLADAASTGGTAPIGHAVTSNTAFLRLSAY